MITFERAMKLKPGDKIYQEAGWDGDKVVWTYEYQVIKVGPKSLTVRNPKAVWGGTHRFISRDFPLRFWSLKNWREK